MGSSELNRRRLASIFRQECYAFAVAELESGLISAPTKAALAQHRKRGVRLGGPPRKIIDTDANGRAIYGDVVAKGSAKGRAAARRAIQRRADARASDLASTIKALQEAGYSSLTAIAEQLNDQSIPTARGSGSWSPTQVARVLRRLERIRRLRAETDLRPVPDLLRGTVQQ